MMESAPPNNLLLQQRYAIQRELGSHFGCKTYLAVDNNTQEQVVVKTLLWNAEFSWEVFKLFEREALILQTLSHPAIPRYIDYFEIQTPNSDGFALVQSYVEALSLEAHLKAGRRFSETELKELAETVLEILIYLHGHSPPIIHRDIKPSNLLLGDRSGHSVGKVYLIDFGSVQAAASDGSTRTIVGTYGYMPLEQFGDRAVPASDLYSLGATLIYLACGQHPADLPAQNLRICFEQYVTLSSPFINWLQWMIEPGLNQRPQSAQVALESLRSGKIEPRPPYLLTKPVGSKVSLHSTPAVLQISLPSRGFGWYLWQDVFILIFLIPFTLIWLASTISGNWFVAILLTFIVPTAVCKSLWKVLFSMFGLWLLSIDQGKIAVTYRLFGLSQNFPKPMPTEQIIKVEKVLPMTNYNSEGAPTEIKPKINIWAGNKRFEFAGEGFVTPVELDWIAQEIGKWLDLPVVKEHHLVEKPRPLLSLFPARDRKI